MKKVQYNSCGGRTVDAVAAGALNIELITGLMFSSMKVAAKRLNTNLFP